LELSGIGDPLILEKINVPIKVYLPAVGTNAQDHLLTGLSWGALSASFSALIHADYSSAELREPEKFNTIDPLHDPATAAEHAELQCVIPPLSFRYHVKIVLQ